MPTITEPDSGFGFNKALQKLNVKHGYYEKKF
jgi:hypothetical protein